MKKIYLALMCLSVFLFSSCKPMEAEVKESELNHIFDEVNTFSFKGHRYIRFLYGCSDNRAFGVVHDPNCWCHKKGEYDEFR